MAVSARAGAHHRVDDNVPGQVAGGAAALVFGLRRHGVVRCSCGTCGLSTNMMALVTSEY